MEQSKILSGWFLKELEAEGTASRKCLERIPDKLFDWKPHDKSMTMGYLALLVAEIPKWIDVTIIKSEIDFATFEHFHPKTTAELVEYFDENLLAARKVIQNTFDEEFNKPFFLKMKGQVLMSSPKGESVGQSINHLVHHRGQLTVYMRLNNILVPQIYGPSADEKGF
jgi:uncharacterized damage-inducible protein DinB